MTRASYDRRGGNRATERRAEVHPAVLAAAKRGDARAFAEILQHHVRELRLLAFRLLGDQGQMEDALQDSALRAYRAPPRFNGDAALSTWLYRVAYTTCIDHLRRKPARAEAGDATEQTRRCHASNHRGAGASIANAETL
jgi:RNA polymerase sigma factor (sigma-70 family)